jgi:hypothetical protein
MKEFDRVKDGDEYQYIVNGELAMCGDDMLMGVIEDTSERSTSIVVKTINTVRFLNTPDDESQIGICLLGPVRNPNTTPVYYTEIIIGAKLMKTWEIESICGTKTLSPISCNKTSVGAL